MQNESINGKVVVITSASSGLDVGAIQHAGGGALFPRDAATVLDESPF